MIFGTSKDKEQMGTNKHANRTIASPFSVFQNGDAETVERLWTSVYAVDGLLTHGEVVGSVEVRVGFSVLRHFHEGFRFQNFSKYAYSVVDCFCILVG